MIVREGEEYVFLNGNQLGTILIDYVLKSMKEKGSLDDNPLSLKLLLQLIYRLM